MRFQHSPAIWGSHPSLVAGVLSMRGISSTPDVSGRIGPRLAAAAERLTTVDSLSELPEIRAWRRAFADMGLKPTQYRCASESLLRRFGKDGTLPRIHPLVDLCNAVSVASALPIAPIDLARVDGDLTVRHATGDERYLAFSGKTEHPAMDEVVFADEGGDAHARRWTHRQSARSAIRPDTEHVLVVIEGLHESAPRDVPRTLETLASELRAAWGGDVRTAVLSARAPVFAAD